jgi:3-oxoacyl-[acyl-carrier-protein] synthase-3
MPGATIIGSGRYVPGRAVSNDALSRVMDTSSAWIVQRTGVEQRHFAPDGVGVSDLAVPACVEALAAADLPAEAIDYVLFNTMTPDYAIPGSGALLGQKLGIPGVPALDLRQQCAAMPFSLQVADGLLSTGAAEHVLLVGADAHAGFMPWRRWDLLEDEALPASSSEDYTRATEHRGMAILFGDGAGALVLRRAKEGGLLGVRVHSDGRLHDALRLSVGGFRQRPHVTPAMLDADEHVPRMKGSELFKAAALRLPVVIRDVCRRHQVTLDDVDWFIGHQANLRINQVVRETLRVPESKLPSNIARYGNTSSATIPILMDELLRSGRIQRGQLLCFFALGAGLHWGAALMRF